MKNTENIVPQESSVNLIVLAHKDSWGFVREAEPLLALYMTIRQQHRDAKPEAVQINHPTRTTTTASTTTTSKMTSRLCLLLSILCLTTSQAQEIQTDIPQFHGSGSSVGSRCFWHILETMTEQTKLAIRATYRSTGSGTGEEEFMGNITYPFNDFGSADYPLPKDEYDALQAAGQGMIHLPIVMGAIGVFHSVPKLSREDLNLTSCLLARIFKGEVNDWTHKDILAINPTLKLPVQYDFYGKPKEDQSYPISVVHRADSSGSTNTFTSYLHKACPEHWEADLVGSSITWPMEGSDFLYGAETTSAIISTLHETPSVIGYADAGAGLDEGLDEVALKIEHGSLNEDYFLTSKNSLSKDGLAAALESEGTKIPERGDVDWSGVDVINQVEGYIYAWPMVAITYAYVRKNLTFIPDPQSQSLLKAFLKTLYDPAYTKKCVDEYLFFPVPESLRNIGLASIEMLETSPDAPEWIQEADNLPGVGQGPYVISSRRKSSSTMQLDLLTEKVGKAETTLEEVVQGWDDLKESTTQIKGDLDKVLNGKLDEATESMLDDIDQRLDATFIMSITSLASGFVMLLFVLYQQRQIQSLQARPPVKVAKKATKPLPSAEASD